MAETNDKYVEHCEIKNGHLIVYYREGDNMSVIDLGNVVGPQGPKGEPGENGVNGVTPSFYIGNGSGENQELGHLYVDYDNPVE